MVNLGWNYSTRGLAPLRPRSGGNLYVSVWMMRRNSHPWYHLSVVNIFLKGWLQNRILEFV